MAGRANPEREQQRAVIAWLKRVLPQGSIVQAIVNEQKAQSNDAYERARFGLARRASGVKSGFPDILILLPEGRCCFLEMKKPPSRNAAGKLVKGTLEGHQGDLHEDMRAIGHRVGVATCIETARYALVRMGVETREVTGQPSRPAEFYRGKSKRLVSGGIPF